MHRGVQLKGQMHGLKEDFLHMQIRHELLITELCNCQQQATQTQLEIQKIATGCNKVHEHLNARMDQIANTPAQVNWDLIDERVCHIIPGLIPPSTTNASPSGEVGNLTLQELTELIKVGVQQCVNPSVLEQLVEHRINQKLQGVAPTVLQQQAKTRVALS